MNNKLKNLKLEDNFKGTFAEYVNQKVPHPTSPNQEITLETDYQLFLASKKRKPNGFDSNLKKYLSLEWIKIKDLYFDGTINVRNRVFHIKDRNKTYELASKYRPSALDALHVVRIEGKNYVDDGQKRSAGSLLRFGNPEMLVPCLVDITLEDLPEKEIERKRRSGFVTINMERDQLDKFTQYASRYADGDAMATAIFNITIPTHCAVNPNTEDRPIFKALGTIEKIIKGKYTGDSIDVLDKHLKRVRGPKVQQSFIQHRNTYLADYPEGSPHGNYILGVTAFFYTFDNLVGYDTSKLDYVMKCAKDLDLIKEYDKDTDTTSMRGILSDEDFVDYGNSLKGRTGHITAIENFGKLWNTIYDEVKGAKLILGEAIDKTFLNNFRIYVTSKKGFTFHQYTYDTYIQELKKDGDFPSPIKF